VKEKRETEQQKLVDSYFRSTVPDWEEIYSQQGVYATIYQERRIAALALLEGLSLQSGSRILEVGCGPGLTTVAMAARGHAVFAIDTVQAMADRTREAAINAKVADRVKVSVGDIHQLAFADGTFHLAIVVGVTEWLDSLDQSFQELVRVLKPRGHLVVASDNKWALYRMLDPLFNPVLAPLKHVARELALRTGARKPRPRLYAYSIPDFDSHLRRVGLVKMEGLTLGFGPFSFLGLKVLPEFIGLRLHRVLQRLANKGVPFIRSGGLVYLAAASKLASDR